MRSQNAANLGRLLRSDWFILGACLLIGAFVSISKGQANEWDLRNYHIYNAWALLNHRASKDVFVAGIQTYFSPFIDVPYYLVSMVWLPGHPRLAAALAGLPFGALIFATVLITRDAFADLGLGRGPGNAIIVASTTTAAVTGVSTWTQVGTSSNEITVGALVLGAVALLLAAFGPRPSPRMTMRRSLAVGFLLGLAAGLKLTAAIYTLAGALLLLATCRGWRDALRCGAAFSLSWSATFLITFGPWAWHLYATTGNPLFPMFNNVFHSTLAAEVVGRDTRFLPTKLLQWLFYPFYWVCEQHTAMELNFRDARFALAYALLLVALPGSLVRWRRGQNHRYSGLAALATFWILAFSTWLIMFSLLRYAVALEVCASIMAVGIVLAALDIVIRRGRILVFSTVSIGLALFLVRFARIPDLGHVPFGDRTFSAPAPELGDHPLVVLSDPPMGFLAPLIERTNPGATFVGTPPYIYKFSRYGLGASLRRKIANNQGRLYVAYYAGDLLVDARLAEFGVHVSGKDCRVMETNRTPDVSICPAQHTGGGTDLTQPVAQRFHLAMEVTTEAPDVSIHADWHVNPCVNASRRLGKLTLHWSMPASVGPIQIFVQSKPSPPLPFFAGGSTDSAETHTSVMAGQRFIFTEADTGRELAHADIRYVPCDRK